jgi:hypothetical protein
MTTELVPVTRTVVGDREQLAHYLRTTSAAGRLITEVGDIEARVLAPGRFAVKVTVREPAPKLTWRQRSAALDRRHLIAGPCLKALTWGVMVVLFIVSAAVAIFEIGYHAIGAATLGKAFAVIVGGSALIAVLSLFARSGDGHRKGYGYHWSKCK